MRARADESWRVRVLTATIVVATAVEAAGLLTYAWQLRSIVRVVFAPVCLGMAAVRGYGLAVTFELSDLAPRTATSRRSVLARRRRSTSTIRHRQSPHTLVTPGMSGPASVPPRAARHDTAGHPAQPAGVAR